MELHLRAEDAVIPVKRLVCFYKLSTFSYVLIWKAGCSSGVEWRKNVNYYLRGYHTAIHTSTGPYISP